MELRNQNKLTPVCLSCQKANLSNIATTPQRVINNDLVTLNSRANSIQNTVSRSHDQILRIWFNSYFDEYNNFHDSQYIYTIIQPAKWLVNEHKASS